jgi:16S rRNA (cytidine1402-2'-O)-methyltransferase
VVVPTPIGNLGDLSLRQYEALTQSDIVACEDTRKTGKMIELIR